MSKYLTNPELVYQEFVLDPYALDVPEKDKFLEYYKRKIGDNFGKYVMENLVIEQVFYEYKDEYQRVLSFKTKLTDRELFEKGLKFFQIRFLYEFSALKPTQTINSVGALDQQPEENK